MSANRGKVVCLVGPSGVGKTSYAKRLVETYSFRFPTVVTTRRARTDDGSHYEYVSEATFLTMRASGAFLEWDKYTEYYYGTLAQSVTDATASDTHAGVILDLTPVGCRAVVEAIPTCVVIALLPDDPAWLFERLKGRNSQPTEEIQARTELLGRYLEEVRDLGCATVYARFSPDSWDDTFEAIAKIALEASSTRG
ncbi:MAG: guanylate kinase [Candidatus Kerfeldbacteria bacterium]|nr:guanylate kinase [Candidatus Kerfeldbacteria bacterium]